jgi:hypothetical protein
MSAIFSLDVDRKWVLKLDVGEGEEGENEEVLLDFKANSGKKWWATAGSVFFG